MPQTIRAKMFMMIITLMSVTSIAIIVTGRKNFELELTGLYRSLAGDALQSAVSLLENEYGELLNYKLDRIARRRELMENMSSGLMDMIRQQHSLVTSGWLSEETARKNILDHICKMRYGNGQYFFVCDMKLRGLAHPLKTMIGKIWTGYPDMKQRDALWLIREHIREEKKAYTVFQWPSLSEPSTVKQLGFFRYFPQWEWLIGTTVPIDDLEKESDRQMQIILGKLGNIFPKMKFAEKGSLFLYDGKGNLLIRPEKSIPHMSSDSFFAHIPAASQEPGKAFIHTCCGQQRHIMYVRYFKTLDWYAGASIPWDVIREPVDRLALRQTYILLGLLFIGLLMTGLFSKKIVRPLETLARYAIKIPGQNFAVQKTQPPRTASGSSREIRELEQAFIFMDMQLGRQIIELNQYQEHLEHLVDERTSELSFINKELQKENSERRKAEEKLQETVSEYRSLFENMYSAFAYHQVIFDNKNQAEDYIFLEINEVFEQLTGLGRDIIGKKVKTVLPGIENNEPDFIGIYGKVADNGTPIKFEAYSEPMRQWFAISAYSPKKGFFVTVFDDITERKWAEQKLQEYSEHLEELVGERTKELRKTQEELLMKERLAVLGHFAGSLSHEIRNPLNIIYSSAYYLKTKLENRDEKICKHIDRITTYVDRATGIIQSLLSLTRMEKPRTEIHDPGVLVHEILRKSDIPDTVEIIREYPSAALWILADRDQMHMALKNIVKNALQSMKGSGRLGITLAAEAGQTEISVWDSGQGIPPEDINRIFEPLFTTKAQGIGFGLSITRMIIENHGGNIRAESVLGEGTTFTITLPSANMGQEVCKQTTGPAAGIRRKEEKPD